MVEITTPQTMRSLKVKLGLKEKVINQSQNSIFPVVTSERKFGTLLVLNLGNPAAGAEYTTRTVAVGKIWRMKSFAGSLVTDVTVANRRPTINFGDEDGNVIAGSGWMGNQTASSTVPYRAAINLPTTTALAANVTFPLPDIFLKENYTIAFVTSSIQAGDDWAQGFATVEEFDMEEVGYIE